MTTHKVKSVCPYCGVGCGIVLEVAGNRVVKVTGDKEHPTNYGRLCTKGSTCAQAIAESGRLEYAYRRPERGGDPVRTGVDQAIGDTARRLRAILDEHGPDAISFYVSGQMSLEAQYLINKLAKGFIRTNNIESNSRLCMASAGSGYKLSLGADGPPGSYQDMDRTNLFFVIGANMADCHPILFLRVLDRVKAGAKLIVVDPRRNATADKATLFMQIKPGTDLALLNGILHLIVVNGHTDPAFIAEFTSGWEAMPEFLQDYTPDRVSAITGIPEADIRLAAQWIGESPEWMSCWTMGLNQSTHGTWHTNAICNLHLATGKICRPGSGPFSLTGQPNAMGGREMGYMGPGLPGQRSVLVEAERQFIEDMWRIPRGSIRTGVGTGTVSMFENMQAGAIKACWIICTNPVATVPNRRNVIAGLQAAEFVITQDAFFDTETNRYADMMLPGALWSEAEGVMINSERNLTLMRQAVRPPGEALPDWQIIARVACEMGYSESFSYNSSAEVYREIQQAWNPKTGYDIRGASYDRLREAPQQWPCAPDAENNRNPIRYLNDGVSQKLKKNEDGSRPRLAFATESGKGVFLPRPYLPPAEMPDNDYGFVLNTGRLQHQWHTMTKTGKIPALNKLNPGPFVEIHPEDAEALGIRENDRVQIRSRRGLSVLPAVVTDRVRPGNCFAPFHWNDVFGDRLAINEVTNDAVDPISYQPELKYCAVSLARVNESHTPEGLDAGKQPPQTVRSANHSDHPAQHTYVMAEVDVNYTRLEEEPYMSKVDALATLLGIESSPAVTFESHEKMYLSGFITSLRTDDSRASSGVPVLPLTAPLEPAKKHWFDGMLAGMFSRTYIPDTRQHPVSTALQPSPPPAEEPVQAEQNGEPSGTSKVTIVWASQTGNAEGAALEAAKRLQKGGHNVRVVGMDAFNAADLSAERSLLLIASTFGAGDPPDNGVSFWKKLQGSQMPQLPKLRYAVLAFGDSSYDQFCGFGRNLDARLEQLGAQRLCERLDCDTDSHDRIETWVRSVETALNAENVSSEAKQPEAAASAVAQSAEHSAPVEAAVPRSYDRNNPLLARVVSNQLLNKEGSEKETRTYVFDLTNSGMRYEAGDALGVWPTNCPELVQEIMEAAGLEPSALVNVKERQLPLSEALMRHFEISRITTAALQYVYSLTNSERLGQLLQSGNKAELKKWLTGRQLADVLREYPIKASAESFVAILKPLQPRLYSISSSPNMNPNEVHITVSTVRYQAGDTMRKGVCSTYLADRVHSATEVPIFIQKTAHFRPPANPDSPMIMVGPGTGVGPFRGFLQERQAIGAQGKNWLFFGEQRSACDFYFREELEAMLQNGHLHRLDTAFSRDQTDKVYVQDRMLEHGAELWAWLQEGAHFYICGDASSMAKEVEAALKRIIEKHGGLSASEADVYVKEMAKSKRYAKDVY